MQRQSQKGSRKIEAETVRGATQTRDREVWCIRMRYYHFDAGRKYNTTGT